MTCYEESKFFYGVGFINTFLKFWEIININLGNEMTTLDENKRVTSACSQSFSQSHL